MENIEETEEQSPVQTPKPRQRYKSSKGDADKRKVSSSVNLEKARQSKIAMARERRDMKTFEINSDSSSDDEEIIITKRSDAKKKKDVLDERERLTRLENMIANMAMENKKRTNVVKKHTVIQLPPSQAPVQQHQAPPSVNIHRQQLLNLI